MHIIVASTGEVITLEGRAWSFARQAGFSMQAGDTISLAGFYEGDDFEIGYVENLTRARLFNYASRAAAQCGQVKVEAVNRPAPSASDTQCPRERPVE